MAFDFHTDEDTKRLLEVTVFFLQKYFGYEEAQAVDLMNLYYNTMKIDDNDYHREGPFHVAVLVHYVIGLKGDGQKFLQWKQENGLINAPGEAVDYAREHYYKNK
jgi:hypothetical protein